MSNYINLIGQITERLDVPCGNIRLGIHEALAYLDRNPSQAPGRTITQSRLRELTGQYHSGAVYSFSHWLDELGIVEVPDPGLTNVGKLETEIRELLQEPSQSFSIARDLAEKLDTAGWTKAPGVGE